MTTAAASASHFAVQQCEPFPPGKLLLLQDGIHGCLPRAGANITVAPAQQPWWPVYGNFDVVVDNLARILELCATLHALWDVLYVCPGLVPRPRGVRCVVPALIRCWLVLAMLCPIRGSRAEQSTNRLRLRFGPTDFRPGPNAINPATAAPYMNQRNRAFAPTVDTQPVGLHSHDSAYDPAHDSAHDSAQSMVVLTFDGVTQRVDLGSAWNGVVNATSSLSLGGASLGMGLTFKAKQVRGPDRAVAVLWPCCDGVVPLCCVPMCYDRAMTVL